MNITKTRKNVPRRLIVHGVRGIGKSTFAASAPSCVFVPTEDGLSGIDAEAFPVAKSYTEFMGNLRQLHTEEHSYRTVCVDGLDDLERMIWEHICKRDGKESIEDYGYGKGYIIANGIWREVLKLLNQLRDDRKMMVILLAHTEIRRFDDPETEAYDRYQLRINKHAAAMLSGWCDDMLFAKAPVVLKSAGKKMDGTRKIPLATDDRVLRTRETAAAEAKNRFSVDCPDEIPLAWSEYAKYAFPKHEAADAPQKDEAE